MYKLRNVKSPRSLSNLTSANELESKWAKLFCVWRPGGGTGVRIQGFHLQSSYSTAWATPLVNFALSNQPVFLIITQMLLPKL
jgi:hypothetical protein